MSAHTLECWHQTSRRSLAANADQFGDLGSEASTLRVLYPADFPEMLGRTEDLWMRIKCHPGLRLHVMEDTATGTHLVLVRSIEEAMNMEGHHMLAAVQDMDFYQWIQADDEQPNAMVRKSGLVADISHEAGVVVIELKPMDKLATCVGASAQWLVRGLLNRIQSLSATHGVAERCHSPKDPEDHSKTNWASHWQEQMRALKLEIDAMDTTCKAKESEHVTNA